MSKRTLVKMDQNARRINPNLAQIDKLIKENNQLKIEKVVLQKEMQRIIREYKVKERDVENEIMGETMRKNYEQSKILMKELEEKIYVLENENNLLKINNEFQRKALQEADDNSNFSQFSNFSSSKKDRSELLELKEKVGRLELIKMEQEREIKKLKRVVSKKKFKEHSLLSCSEGGGGGNEPEFSISSISGSKKNQGDSRMSKSFQTKYYEDKEKMFNSLVRRAMIQIASSINTFVNEEVSKNQDTLVGMEISCKLEELRQKLIRLINTKISVQA